MAGDAPLPPGSADPYLLAARREAARWWSSASLGERIGRVAIPAIATAVAAPLVRRVFLGFLDEGPAALPEGVAEVVFRADLLLLSAVLLDLHDRIVRGRDRAVLAVLPVDPAGVVRKILVEELGRLAVYVLAGAAVLGPVAAARPAVWSGAVASLAGAAALAVPLGAVGHLGALLVAEAPAAQPVLELVRGPNQRAQAAIIAAPGLVLLLGGGLLRLSALGAARADLAGAALLALPFAAGAAVAALVPAVARRAWFRGTVVLAEIDARYASLEDPEEGRRVYLDWLVRFLPERTRLYALADLRHGWRARRTPIALGWALAAVALWAGWGGGPVGLTRAAVLAAAGPFLAAAVAVGMEADEPPLLRRTLPKAAGPAALARALVTAAWAAPGPIGAAAGVALAGDAAGVPLGAGAAGLGVALAVAAACGRLRERGPAVYVPVGGAAFLAVAAAAAGAAARSAGA